MSQAARKNPVPAAKGDATTPPHAPGLAEAPRAFRHDTVREGTVDPRDLLRTLALHMAKRPGPAPATAPADRPVPDDAELHHLGLGPLDPDPELLALVDPADAVRLRYLPLRRDRDTVIVAVADPSGLAAVRRALTGLPGAPAFAVASTAQIHDALTRHCRAALSAAANSRPRPDESCRGWTGRRPALVGLSLVFLLAVTALLAPQIAVLGMAAWIGAALLLNGALKITMLLASMDRGHRAARERRPDRLPRVSILVPMLHETDIADRLIRRMGRLSYPRDLLEICLVYEEDDTATRRHLGDRPLPYWMRLIEVPRDTLQTKPRAMNFALDFCRGDVIGIYDAEDAPEPDQIWRAVSRLAAAGDDVACAQCALDYYNSRTNWISRCFTVEYAILFRVILPGLERLGLPIPLGGTSVFFKRGVLEELGRWDAQNVTEDADLGMRLHRRGYRCVLAASTTYEEANFRALPWMRQRSRWLKGFLQTWMTHMRRPRQLWRDVGGTGFFVIQALFLGTVTSFLLAPVVLPMWLMTLGVTLPIYAMVPTALLWALIAGFVATEAFLVALGVVALRRRPEHAPARWTVMMPLYWPLGALAALKAIWELFARPNWWDKTAHGINDAACQAEIDRLTRHPAKEKDAAPAASTGAGG